MQIGCHGNTDLYWTYCSSGDTDLSHCRCSGERHSAGRAAVVDGATGPGAWDSRSSRVLPRIVPLTTSDGCGGCAGIVAVAVDWVIVVRLSGSQCPLEEKRGRGDDD